MNTYKILVLDASQRSALAVVRSLGQTARFVIYTADTGPIALAGTSKFSHTYISCPSSTHSPAAFISWIKKTQQAELFDLVIPVTEITSQLLLMHSAESGDITLPFAPYDTVMALADKHQLLLQAQASGVPAPRFEWFANAAAANPDTFDYPCVIKPCLSRIYTEQGWISTSVKILNARSDWEAALAKGDYLQHSPFMVQEFIPGSGAGVFALYDKGRAVTFFAHKRLREKPPQGGVSVLSESIAVDPLLQGYARKLLDHVNWHGVAMVEFRISPEGRPFLMEVNTRFWGSLQLAVDSGVDFPRWLVELALGQQPVVPEHYRQGQKLRWLLGDLDSLYLVLKGPNSLGHKIRCILAFITPSLKTRHEINRWGDFGPGIFEFKQYLAQLMGRQH